jgi:hypothetical protein
VKDGPIRQSDRILHEYEPPNLNERVNCLLMPKNGKWSREQLIIAIKLYCEMPFGKMHSRNPTIIKFAKMIGRTPSALAMKLTNFASLDPEITLSGRKGLSGASYADRRIWNEMTSNWAGLAIEAARIESSFSAPVVGNDERSKNAETLQDYFGKTRTVETEARIGQAFFRNAVLSAYGFKCCISKTSIPLLLVASHIVPWRSDPHNRLNPRNGLCLSAIHDCAFDQGLITVTDEYRLRLSFKLLTMRSEPLISSAFVNFDGMRISLPEKFLPDGTFLEYHREHVFVA